MYFLVVTQTTKIGEKFHKFWTKNMAFCFQNLNSNIWQRQIGIDLPFQGNRLFTNMQGLYHTLLACVIVSHTHCAPLGLFNRIQHISFKVNKKHVLM